MGAPSWICCDSVSSAHLALEGTLAPGIRQMARPASTRSAEDPVPGHILALVVDIVLRTYSDTDFGPEFMRQKWVAE
jgi:hypothetical protein